MRLYAGTVEQLDFEATFEVVKEIIESPAKFAPSVGEIVTKARARMEIAERDRRLAMPCKHTPGEVRYDPKGRKYVADENGDLQLREVPDEILNTGRRAS
ncbi:MAG: hypothetical protein Q7S58_02880 [Candidatus Binatus sp.]|uniref:hypothetical protein n=1 Tax=Candidatus Binatus sp. TaxID=2811406 RepID=UPI002721EE19|nr:hypothetical protein [Candidatus Binatus sp.]MDO8431333.1 hypothetical protein [Candidatus Binatus sp.]